MILAFLVACAAENSCETYVDAARACAAEADADTGAYDLASICGAWSADAEQAYGEWYVCQADVWAAADCASAAGVQAGADAASACVPP